MASDINSMPNSPRHDRAQPAQGSQPTSASSTSRRPSHQMPPPPVPAPQSQSHRTPTMTGSEHPGVPLRHPRPLTAAELFDECEKEQEAVVNRLTRELTALRAQSASVASNASQSSNSTSASLLPVDISDPNPAHQLTGATHPTPSRQRRSSSSLSTRSIPHTPSTSAPVAASGVTNMSNQVQAGSVTGGHSHGISQASAGRAAATGSQRSLSRQPSVSASGTSTPARTSLEIARAPGSYALSHRPSLSRDPSYMSQATNASSTAAHAGTPGPPPVHNLPSPAQSSPSQSISTPHYADTAAYRSEMEIVKAENEALRQRVRALERALLDRRRDSSNSETARSDVSAAGAARMMAGGSRGLEGSAIVTSPEPPATTRSAISPGVTAWAGGNDGGVGGVAGPRERSESQSTTASSRRGVPGEDEVRLGESAGSVGIGRGI